MGYLSSPPARHPLSLPPFLPPFHHLSLYRCNKPSDVLVYLLLSVICTSSQSHPPRPLVSGLVTCGWVSCRLCASGTPFREEPPRMPLPTGGLWPTMASQQMCGRWASSPMSCSLGALPSKLTPSEAPTLLLAPDTITQPPGPIVPKTKPPPTLSLFPPPPAASAATHKAVDNTVHQDGSFVGCLSWSPLLKLRPRLVS